MKKYKTIEIVNSKIPSDSKLTAIEFKDDIITNSSQKRKTLLCLCKCGKYVICDMGNVIKGNKKSCGCWISATTFSKTHGMSNHPLYRVWSGMKRRCYLKTRENYKLYGGMGVEVCQEWLYDFMNFYNWAMTNGWQKGLQIDRYPNKDGNYEPSNCRCVTALVNNRNKRNTIYITHNGLSLSLGEWSEKLNIPQQNIRNRIKWGWKDSNKILSTLNYTLKNNKI